MKKWPERLGIHLDVRHWYRYISDQESLAQQSSNLEARIDRGSSNNVTIEATSLDRAVNIRQIRVLLAASRCATAQSKENPGILSQCHGKRDKKPSAASPRNCLLSKSGLPHHPAPQKAMMRARRLALSVLSSRVSSCCMKNKLLLRIFEQEKSKRTVHNEIIWRYAPPRGSGHVESRSSRRFLLLVPVYSCIVTSFTSPQGAFGVNFFCSLNKAELRLFFFFTSRGEMGFEITLGPSLAKHGASFFFLAPLDRDEVHGTSSPDHGSV